MSHNSAPHNLVEVCNALITLITKGSMTVDELLNYIPGPDFPLGGKVLNSKDVREAFATGKSKVSLKIQGDYEIEGQKIIFTTIPYRTYRNKIKEQIQKNIDTFSEVLDDFDDESNIGQNRLIFYVKKGVPVDKALNKLFLLTDLQSTLSYNMNYIVNGTPKLCSMIDLLQAYIHHQEEVLIKATEYDKEKAEARAHILRGLIAAVDQIDRVIEFIKQSESKNEARLKLIDFLTIDEIQANAILDMKLGKLTRIDKEELVNELAEKEKFIARCIELLTSQDARNNELIRKITELRDTYGDARRTQLLNVDTPKAEKEESVIVPQECVVVVNQKGMVKRVSKRAFKPQKRATAGVKTSDMVIFTAATNTLDYLMVFTNNGKMRRWSVGDIPEGTNVSAGVFLSLLMDFNEDEVPIAFTTMTRDTAKKYIFFATKKGMIKKVPLSEYDRMKRNGIIAITIKEGDELAAVTFIDQEDMMLFTKNGMCIRFATSSMPISSRTAQGVKGMNVAEDDEVIAALPISDPAQYLAVIGENGLGKLVELKEFGVQNRGGKGVIYHKSAVAGVAFVNKEDSLLISGDKTSIVIKVEEMPLLGKIAAGNIMLKNNDKVNSVAKI